MLNKVKLPNQILVNLYSTAKLNILKANIKIWHEMSTTIGKEFSITGKNLPCIFDNRF